MVDNGKLKCNAFQENSVPLTLHAVAGDPDTYIFATPSGVYLGLGKGPGDDGGSVVTVQQAQALPIKIFREGGAVYLARGKKTV